MCGGSGAVSAFAGSGESGHSSTSAALSQFCRPFDVCFDPSAGGSVICSDEHSLRGIKNGACLFGAVIFNAREI